MEWLFVVAAIAAWGIYRYALPQKQTWHMAAPPEFLVLDFETTGLHPARHEIIEVGAILVQRDQLTQKKPEFKTFQTLVRPSGSLPGKIVDMTGITDEMIARDGVDCGQAIRGLVEFIGDRPVYAFNAPFDQSFFEAAAKSCNFPVQQITWRCILEAARSRWPGLPSYKLADLSKTVDTGTHRALADAQRALLVYVASLKP